MNFVLLMCGCSTSWVESASGCVLGLSTHADGEWLLTLKDIDRHDLLDTTHGPAWRNLDVSVLHRGLLERIMGMEEGTELLYEPNTEAALELVRSGQKAMVFLMNGATPEQILACADAHEFMPQKATYLFPKLPTGTVFHRLV